MGEIKLSESLATIGSGAFLGAGTWFSLSPDNEHYAVVDGILYAKDTKTLLACPARYPQRTLIVPEGIVAIGNSAFQSCSTLVAITLPESLETIGARAFFDCRALEEIVIREGVTSIGNETFSWCYSLAEIALPQGVTSVESRAFAECSSLAEVKLPGSVTFIADDVFENCSDHLKLTVERDSYAREYAREYGIAYDYPDPLFWLHN